MNGDAYVHGRRQIHHPREFALLTTSEQRVLRTFRRYLMTPGKMLCFYGPTLKQDKPALDLLAKKDFVVEEKFKGGYSLTKAGYAAMNCFE
jgi:hypothetical protein